MKFLRTLGQARFRSRLVWYFRQLFPLTYWAAYSDVDDDGVCYNVRFVIWKMWFGRCYRVTDIVYQDHGELK